MSKALEKFVSEYEESIKKDVIDFHPGNVFPKMTREECQELQEVLSSEASANLPVFDKLFESFKQLFLNEVLQDLTYQDIAEFEIEHTKEEKEKKSLAQAREKELFSEFLKTISKEDREILGYV